MHKKKQTRKFRVGSAHIAGELVGGIKLIELISLDPAPEETKKSNKEELRRSSPQTKDKWQGISNAKEGGVGGV